MARGLVLSLILTLAACGGSTGAVTIPSSTVPAPLTVPAGAFVNWENLSVHPVDLTPDGATRLVCNTPDQRLELFDVSEGLPVALGSVQVGVDPVSVRARSNTEAWVVNHISDSVSVVHLPTRRVRATLQTLDEPADVVFAGSGRAFVSCSQANTVLVFDAGDLTAAPATVAIDAEEPRALAVSPDGATVYAAVFESGNGSTGLGGGVDPGGINTLAFPPNAVSDADGPHGGVNPPPNDGAAFAPPLRAGNPAAPAVGLIVKKDAAGAWRDDTGADWSDFVGGARAARSGRVPGWDLPDRDLAVIDAGTLAVTYVQRCMNVCAALAVHPQSGRVTLVGTDGTNEVRYEPVLSGRFLRVLLADIDPTGAAAPGIVDLNPHLDYTSASVPQAERDRSLGDPRGIIWNADGTRAFVTGMGSNNVAVLDAQQRRIGRIEVGEGPTGIALSPDGARAYVLNRFAGSISVLDVQGLTELARIELFDPTPQVIRRGRRHLYGTHETSGLGQAACASCHVDARTDRLAWDLGDPAGSVEPMDQNCLTALVAPCDDFHPMKGPMLTQTLQDIIGKEPFHWRGDRTGIEEFNGAFISLMGDDVGLTLAQMQEFEDFLETIHFPPNPFRELDNSLPTRLPLDGHLSPGRFGAAGEPMPDGNPVAGLQLYRGASLDGGVPGFQCVSCHTLPTGLGPDVELGIGVPMPSPVGPNGERHHSLVSVDGSTNVSLKIPQLRSLYERVGYEASRPDRSRSGFGFLHDGSVDSIARFVAEPVFSVGSRQEIADLVAFLLCLSGSDLPSGSQANLLELPGPFSRDTHAAIGRQVTFGPSGDDALLAQLVALAAAGAGDLIAKAGGRGWFYDAAADRFLSDRNGEIATRAALRASAAASNELTYMLVPGGTGYRLGIDRDADGFGDATEAEFGTDAADAADFPR